MKNREWEYIFTKNGTIKLMKYHGAETDVSLPAFINGTAVTDISVNTFGDRKLRSLYISENIQFIEKGFFKYNYISKGITASAKSDRYYSADGVLYNRERTVLISCPKEREQVEILPITLKIADYAFYKCRRLENVVMPRCLCEIGKYAFYENVSLISITLPWGLTFMGEGCFCGCEKLQSTIIPANVEVINDYTFENCESLVNVQLPERLKVIGSHAFHQCKCLTDMILPPSLREIRGYAFYDCHKLKEIAVPNECIKISANAFFFCAELTVYYPEKSNYYIIEAARVSCSKEKCRKLYPKRKFTKKEEKEAFVNVDPNPSFQLAYDVSDQYIYITDVYDSDKEVKKHIRKKLFGKSVFISTEDMEE